MTKPEKVRYEMFQRVSNFGAANRGLFPETSQGGRAFAQVAQAAAEIEKHTVVKPRAAQDGLEAKADARKALTEAMSEIARTARGLSRMRPKVVNRLKMPASDSNVSLVAAAWGFVEESALVRDHLIELGLNPAALESIPKAIAALDDAIEGRQIGRHRVASAQEGITAALASGLDAVRMLDVVVPNAVKHDPALLAGWKRDRRVVLGRTKTRPAEEDDPPADPMRRAS